MFGLKLSLEDLSEDERAKLVMLLRKRDAYMMHSRALNDLRITYLQNPTESNAASVEAYNTTVLAPMRRDMQEDFVGLLEMSIDVEGIKKFLPMALAGFLQSVNLPLLLTALGWEPEAINDLINLAKDYMGRDE